MGVCNYAMPKQKDHILSLDKLYDKWRNSPWIRSRFTDNVDGFNQYSSLDSMEWFLSQRLRLPINDTFILSEGELRRANVEIDSLNKKISKGFFNLGFVVPEGISKQDPVSRKYYLNLNEILNYERVAVNQNMETNAIISQHLFDAFASIGLSKRDANKRIQSLRKEMATDDGMNISKWINNMESFIKNDKAGKIFGEFIELVEMPNKEFKKAKTGEKEYSSSVYKAVTRARSHLSFVAGVYTSGLSRLKVLAALRYTGSSDTKGARASSKEYKNFADKIDVAIESIKGFDKDGGYFPHIKFETLLDVKENMSKALMADVLHADASFNSLADRILSSSITKSLPDSVKGRNENIETYWNKDPLFVMEQYGIQAASFNKLINTQVATLEALQNIPKNNDLEFLTGMKRFIAEEYAVFSKEGGGRNAWANRSVKLINSLQTARTMGLNITGAIKNAASAIHYYTNVGFGLINKTKEAMKDEKFYDIMQKVEAEAGFKFKELAPELYSEGTLSESDFKKSDIDFNPITGKITYKNEPLKNAIKDWGKKGLNFLLFFHRVTENNQRKWMFRTSFYHKYNQLTDRGYDENKAIRFAREHGLEMVNRWAYEYAAHGKSKLVRGENRTLEEMETNDISKKLLADGTGASKEIIFHLMHYPSSLFETFYSELSGAKKALLAKQWDADEMQYLMRYAGYGTLLGLASILSNVDLTNIFENEAIERVQRVHSDLTEYDSKTKSTFGLLSEVSGATLGTLKFLGIAGGIIDLEYNDLNKIIFGNVDYSDDDDPDVERFAAYQLSTEWGVLKNKIIPALKSRRGFDVVRHTFKTYPSEFTRKWSEFVYGKSKSKKKKKAPQTDVQRALDLLDKKDTQFV